MKMITNSLRFLMVVLLSLAFVVGNAQRIKPTGNKAPAQAQVTVVKAEKQAIVKENLNADLVKGSISGLQLPSNDINCSNFGGPTDATLWNNGPLVNYPGQGFGGADASAIQSSIGHTLYGWGAQQTAGNSMADDFEVCAEAWDLNTITFYAYQTGSTTTSTMTGIFVQIWSDNPTTGGTLVWGDLITNRLLSTSFTGIYRSIETALTANNRPIMQLVADVSLCPVLGPGHYWVQATATGTLASGPWFPPVSILGQTVTGNALQKQTAGWIAALNGVYPNGMPFIVDGTTTSFTGPDVACMGFVTPVDGPQGTAQNVEIIVMNGGPSTLNNVPVYYIFNSVQYNGIVPTLLSCTPTNYTFTQTVNPPVGNHTIQACTNLSGDVNTANNCKSKTFNILPSTYDCYWTIDLLDSYGDGWNGAAMNVNVGGVPVLTNITLASGYGPLTFNFGVTIGASVDFWFHTPGAYPSECSYVVKENTGAVVYTSPAPPLTNYLVNAYCTSITCPAPTNPLTTLITTNSAHASWTPGGSETSWNYEYGLDGYTQGGAGIIGAGTTTSSFFDMNALLMNTAYDWYVQAVCGVGNLSAWVGPISFTTLCEIPPCPSGGIPENEADIPDDGTDVTNGGCNSTPPVFLPIACGDIYCGQVNTYMVGTGQSRDTDWYRLDLSSSTLFWDLTWTVTSEFDLLIFIINAGNPDDCTNAQIIGSGVTALPCATAVETATGLPPGVYYLWVGPSVFEGYPASAGPHKYTATLSCVSHPAPLATINPLSYDKDVAPDAIATDNLSIGNAAGSLPLTYTATVQNYADAVYTASPLNVNYWTGSVDNTTPPAVFSQTSAVIGAGEQAGWFSFDVSSIPDFATILSIEFNGYANACNWPYWSLTPVTSDPLVATAPVLYADIVAEEALGYYNNFTEASTAVPGWRTAVMGGNANADLALALTSPSNKFTVGMAETDHLATYFINFDGWNETNKPYLVITYSTTPLWLKLNNLQTVSGTVAGGVTDNISVTFNSAGLSVGTYTSEINIVTNEPGAKKTYVLPVTLRVGYRITGNVYYGDVNNLKPQVTATTITLTPTVPPPAGSTIPAGAGGAFVFSPLDNDTYGLIGGSGKAWLGLNAPDPSFAQQYILGTRVLTNLQKRAADINLSGTIQSLDVTMMKRRILGQTYASWIKPNEMVWDGPFVPGWHGVSPTWVQSGLSVIVAGSNVVQNVRCLFSGDVNESGTPLPNP